MVENQLYYFGVQTGTSVVANHTLKWDSLNGWSIFGTIYGLNDFTDIVTIPYNLK
jgi:hypothetical protein